MLLLKVLLVRRDALFKLKHIVIVITELYMIKYKVTVTVIFFSNVITIHKYEESIIAVNVFLNYCKLGNCRQRYLQNP